MVDERDDIARYRAGSLSPAERHALEKKALSDPFLADALEGVGSVSTREFSSDLHELSKKIRDKERSDWFTPLRIAAGVLFIIGGGSLFYFFNRSDPATLAIDQTSKSTSVDSLTAERDSSSKLLTLAKPEESVNKTRKDSEKSNTTSKKDQPRLADETKAGAGAVTEIPKTASQSQPVESLDMEAEKSKNALAEIFEDKKELEQAPAIASGPSEQNKKTRRSAKGEAAFDQSNQNFQTIFGKVTSAEDGSGLPGVNVILKGSNEGTITDSKGDYQLNTQQIKPQLVFSFIGLETLETSADKGTHVDVKLNVDTKQLSEVVVATLGYAKEDNVPLHDGITFSKLELAQPIGGKDAFRKYLESNIQYPPAAISKKTEGKVTVQFVVNPDGSFGDFIVIKGIGSGCDEELIRLIKSGPAWTPTKRDKIPLEDKVKVRLKFSLPH